VTVIVMCSHRTDTFALDTSKRGRVQVSFTLHSSFAVPLRELTTPPFEVHEQGWGEFDVQIKVCTSPREPLLHHLRL
jgi:YEATS family